MSTTTYAEVSAPRRVAVSPVTQRRVVVSEWIKLRSLRSTWFTMAAAVIGLIAVGILISWATHAHWADMHPDERAHFEPVTRSLGGVYLAQLAIGVLGVLVITGEYATGMIRATLGAVPRRLPVLWAKLGVYAVMTLVAMVVSSFIAFEAGQQLLGVHGTTLSAPHALRAVFGVGLYLTVVALLGVALGFVVRSTAGGIATLFGLLLVLPVIGNVLPSSWRTHVVQYFPSNAGGALFTLNPDPGTLAPWTGFAVFCAWAAAAIVAAAVLLMRRDA